MMKIFRRSRLARDKRGVAAVEFALLLPMFAMIYVASVELTELLLANRRVENLASSTADIVARDTLVTDTELTDLQKAITLLIAPNPQAGLKVRVTSIKIESSSSAKVVWSKSYFGYPVLSNGSSVGDLPSTLMDPTTQSVVRTEVQYDYATPIKWLLPSVFTLKHKEYRRPRLVDPVPHA